MMETGTKDTPLKLMLIILRNSDQPFLPERIKIDKCEKLACNLHNKKNYVVHISPEVDTRPWTYTRHSTYIDRNHT